MNRHITIILLLLLLTSCGPTAKLSVSGIGYQSIRTEYYRHSIPSNARISVGYDLSTDGYLSILVNNLSDNIMIIDATKTFFVNTDGVSKTFYDPNVRQESKTDTQSSSTGSSVNLGAVAGALGVGGTIGGLLGAVNVGSGNTEGTSATIVTTFVDLPQISLAPRSTGAMPKVYKVKGIGRNNTEDMSCLYEYSNSNKKFAVCISFSLDNGQTYETLETNFYVNADLKVSVTSYGKVNDALRSVYKTKSDCLDEQWWMLYMESNHYIRTIHEGLFVDWK